MKRPLPVPSRAGGLPARVNRQASGEVARIEGGLTVALAADRARVRRVAGLTEDALMATARLSAVEALAGQIVPHAQGRLKLIADAGAVGLLTIINDVASS
jgi:hypothetical protein